MIVLPGGTQSSKIAAGPLACCQESSNSSSSISSFPFPFLNNSSEQGQLWIYSCEILLAALLPTTCICVYIREYQLKDQNDLQSVLLFME